MKIIIMTDMEGVAGVMNSRAYCSMETSRYYDEAVELTTLEVSAAVEGALQAGATEVLVIDGHGYGAISRTLLHPRALLAGGRPTIPPIRTVLDGSYAAAMMIGQHAKANTDGGHLSHTGSFRVEDESINGVSMGEIGQWFLLCGYYDVPVVMVSGDEAACNEARDLVPNIETAAVKYGIPHGSAAGLTMEEAKDFNCVAIHLSPDRARERIREAACLAVQRVHEIGPLHMDPPYTFKVTNRPEKRGARMRSATIKSTDLVELINECRMKAKARIDPKGTFNPVTDTAKRKPAKTAAKKKSARAASARKPATTAAKKSAPKSAGKAAKPAKPGKSGKPAKSGKSAKKKGSRKR